MIESRITSEDIYKWQSQLIDLIPETQDDWSEQIDEAFKEVVSDIRDMGWNIRKLCKRYSLQTSVTKTDAYNGVITSTEDNLQRLRIVIDVTAFDSSAEFLLQGTDDDGTIWETAIESIQITEVGEKTVLFTRAYKKYRLILASVVSTITYSAFLIETTFERLHVYKSLEIIYRALNNVQNDVYKEKQQEYMQMYNDRINIIQFAYDEDDDETVSDLEIEDDSQQVTWGV